MKDDSFYYMGLYGLAAIAIVFFTLRELERFKVSRASIILVFWSLIIATSCVLPPWIYTAERYRSERSAGYHVLFNAPEPDRGFGARIDLPRLALEWLIVSAVIGPFWWIAKRPKA